MVWAFICGSLGALAYISYLVMEHLREASLISDQIRRHRELVDEGEGNVLVAERGRDEAKARCSQFEQEFNDLKKSVDEVQTVINERKKQMAQRGRFRVG